MSSSDYIALKKFKELKGNCSTDELGDPLSPSWYNVPINDNCDCTVVLGTGPTGNTGATGNTGPTGPPVRLVLPDQRKVVYLLFLAKPMDLMLQTMMGLFFHLGPDKIIREIMVLPWESIVV